MPKIAKELSAIGVKRLTSPGLHAVGGVRGLLLQVSPSGARSWILRWSTPEVRGHDRNGRPIYQRRDLGLGPYPEVTLAMARDKARAARERIAEGIDPIVEKKAARARLIGSRGLTFDECMDKHLALKVSEFRNPKHAAQWRATLETYASPIIGKLPVSEIELQHVVDILAPIWLKKTETAKRLRGRIESVLSWATVSGYRTGDNPARWKGNLDAVLPKPSKVMKVEHHRALPIDAVPGFLADLRQREGMAARALEFVVLTAARSGEVRGATWSEIDLDAKTWTIPADRMKAGNEHRVPLSDAVLALLEALPRFENCELVFPGSTCQPLSDMSLSAVMRRMGANAVPHGFRSSFRDWCSERTGYPRDVCEMALAHTIGNKVEAAYRRGDLLAKRARLMDEWAKFCTTPRPSGTVVTLQSTNKATA